MEFKSDTIPGMSSVQARPANQLLTVTLAAVNCLGEDCENVRDGGESPDGYGLDTSDCSQLVIIGPEMPSSSTLSQCLSIDSRRDCQSKLSQSVSSEFSSSHSVRLPTRKLREIESPFTVKQVVSQQYDSKNTPAALIVQGSSESFEHVDEHNGQDSQALQTRHGLQQGCAIEGTPPASLRPMKGTLGHCCGGSDNNVVSGDSSEIIVSSWALDSQSKHLREDFVRRCQHRRAVKPKVQAHVHRRHPKPDTEAEKQLPQRDDSAAIAMATTAAAAAASAAVASSGPHLQTVHALESRVAGLVSQLESLKDRQENQMTAQQRNLQEQIDRHTQLRLEQLERLGEQQGRLETHFASVLLANGGDAGKQSKVSQKGGADVVSRAIQWSPPEIDENVPPRPPTVSHHSSRRWKSSLQRDRDVAAASPLDSPYGERSDPTDPGSKTVLSGDPDSTQRRVKPLLGGGSEESIDEVTSDKQSSRHVQVGQSSQARLVRMEGVLETMQSELLDLRQRTSDWRQRLEHKKALTRPSWLPLSPRELTKVEDVVRQCEISRRNLEDNIASVIRQGENRFWYEETLENDHDKKLGNGMQELKRTVDKNIAAVSAQIKDELTTHAKAPTSDEDIAIRGSGVVPAKKSILKSRTRSQPQPAVKLRETQRGTVRKLLGKRSSKQKADQCARKKTTSTEPQADGRLARYHVQGKAPIASRGHRRVPYSVLSSDNDRRPVLVQQPVPQYSRPSRDVLSRPLISFMAVPLGPPRRSALADWDKAEKDETTLETGKQTRPVMLSVAVQVEDELGDTGDRVDASHTATLSERRSQLSKRVLSPVNVDTASSHSFSEPRRSSVSSTEFEQQKEMQEMEAPEEETQFDNYLTVQDVVTELHGVHGVDEDTETERHREEDIHRVSECDDISSVQGISVDGQRIQRSSPKYTGPPFPPLPPDNVPIYSTVELRHGVDERSDGTVQQQVCEWVEQEVLAQIFSHMDPPGPEQRLAVELHSPTSSMTMSTDSTSPAEDMTTRLVNGRVVQLFVDAGLPVDVQLVEHVAREVISDMVVTSLGHGRSASVQPLPVSENTVSGTLPGRNATPRSSECGDEEIPTPLPTRSPSPVQSRFPVQEDVTEVEQIDQATPPVTPQSSHHDVSSDEEPVTEVTDTQTAAGHSLLRPFVYDVGDVVDEDQAVPTPADTLSKVSSSEEDNVSESRLLTPQESTASETQSVTSHRELELSASVQLVVAETQTSEQDLLVAVPPQCHHPLSLSGTSSPTSSMTSSRSRSSDAGVATVATTLTTDAEISEGEYLLADPAATARFVQLSGEGPEASEGEFPASPGDTRFVRGNNASGLLKSESLFHQQDTQGDVRGFLKAFLESSPVESVLSESSSSSEPQHPKKSFSRMNAEADPLRELLSRIEPPSQQHHVQSHLTLEGHREDDSDGAQDISIGEVAGSAASHQRSAAGTHQTGAKSPEDLSHGEVMRRDLVKNVVAVSVAEKASTEPTVHSPGEIPLAGWSNKAAASAGDQLPGIQVVRPSDDRLSPGASPDSLALAQAAFREVQHTPVSSPLSYTQIERSDNEVHDRSQDMQLHNSESDESKASAVEEDTTKQDSRSLRSLFSKPNRIQRQRRGHKRETAYLPSVIQQSYHRPQFQQPIVVHPMKSQDEPSAVDTSSTAEGSATLKVKLTGSSHQQVDVNLPGRQMDSEEFEFGDEDTYGNVSSISGGDF